MKSHLLFLLVLPLISFSQSTAFYDITFESVWNATDHGALPGNAHWSDLVGATHNNEVVLWDSGQLATTGLERVAESGANTDLFNEVTAFINQGRADQWLQKDFSPFAAISSATLTSVEVSEYFPLVSLATMVAPSPDWFSGVNSYSLLDTNGNWKTGSITLDVFAYDAGTEDGTGYSGDNPASNPQEPIESLINMYSFNNQKIGTITFTFISSTLSINSNTNLDAIKLLPNPTNGLVTLSNVNSSQITIEVYSILGKNVFNKHIENQLNSDIDLTHLKSGIYIVKILNEISRKTTTKKLIIK
jgi:hypothetical protein